MPDGCQSGSGSCKSKTELPAEDALILTDAGWFEIVRLPEEG